MTTKTLQRLLKHPHAAVFDKDPGAALAFRLNHPDGAARWSVVDRRLIAASGSAAFEYDLSLFSVNTLATALVADGFTVSDLTTENHQLSAMALVDGAGDEISSNGNRLTVYTSLLWVLLSAYAGELSTAADQIPEALRQMVIPTSEGEWLDLWGDLYAETRLPGMSDAEFSAHIPQEAFRLRCNAHAIEKAITDATGFDVRIDEPWKNIFTLDESVLSGPHKLFDGDTIGYHLIQPTTTEVVDWDAVLAVINRNRSAGVMVLGLDTRMSFHVDASDAGFVEFGIGRYRRAETVYEDGVLLDYMMIGDTPVLNETARHRRELMRWSHVQVDQSNYAVTSRGFRDYRLFSFGLVYYANEWTMSTWYEADQDYWIGSPSVVSSHSRSS